MMRCGVLLGLALAAPAASSAPLRVSFRYAPKTWDTCIGLVDDWQKTLVAEDGRLEYDFGGPFNRFHTTIGVGLAGPGPDAIEQRLESPRIPIVITEKRYGDAVLREDAFAVPRVEEAVGEGAATKRLACEPPCEGISGWAKPSAPCDPGFANIAVGWNGPIVYRFRAEKGATYRIGIGLCEGWHGEPGKRILRPIVEGKAIRAVDPVAVAGRNHPVVLIVPARDEDGDGSIEIRVEAAEASPDKNTILNVLWVFPGDLDPPAPEVAAGRWNDRAIAYEDCGRRSGPWGPARNDLLCARIPPAPASRDAAFEVVIRSTRPIGARDAAAVIGGNTFVTTRPAFARTRSIDRGIVLVVPRHAAGPEGEARLVVSVSRGREGGPLPRTWKQAEEARRAAEAYWREAPLPWGRIQVPDPQIQGFLDAAVRNIYQAREIKKGLPAFQVGPTCYRGLWVVDGSFIMEAVAFLGRVEEARAGIRYLLGFQRDDGAIMLINGHWKETGIALWAVARHARLTGDRAWLRSVWPKVRKGVAFIRGMREKTRRDPKAPEAGLIPRGFSDGGLGGVHPEYTNVYWTLVGLRAATDAAAWLGETDDARDFRAEYEGLMEAFRRAAARDMKTAAGVRYLPIRMVDPEKVAPQKAQWAFCHAVFPGKLFAPDDPLVTGNMAILDRAEREGLVYGTGWISNGIWNYFASFWAHAHLWLGDGRKAAEILYAFADHASPLLCWREEQGLEGRGGGGDMPHNWASAEFIRLVRDLLVLERGDELHLLEGLPREWARPGARIALRGILTVFGPVDLTVAVAQRGDRAELELAIAGERPLPQRIVVHSDTWAPEGARVDGKPVTGGRIVRPGTRRIALRVEGRFARD